MKALEVEVLEAITTYSNLHSGRTRPQLQMQTFNLNFGLKINQLNSNTRGELDQNLTARLLDRPIRPNRTHAIFLQVGYRFNQSNLHSTFNISHYGRLL
ncbi:hypothetical protein GIB67_030021, partial [Kingdonia uniflora]